MEEIKAKFIGKWESLIESFNNIEFDYQAYIWGEEKGKWSIQNSEIWLIKENLHDGIKYSFNFEDNNTLMFYNPEDFLYQGGGEYIYYQMTPPQTKIKFSRI